MACPFVTLHQPSSCYDVSSKERSKGRKDKVDLNRGLSELASGGEVFAWFDEVMRHLLSSHDTDWIRMFSGFKMNKYNWSQDEGLRNWLLNNRLDGSCRMMNSVAPDDEEKQAIIERIRDIAFPAVEKLQHLMAQIPVA